MSAFLLPKNVFLVCKFSTDTTLVQKAIFMIPDVIFHIGILTHYDGVFGAIEK